MGRSLKNLIILFISLEIISWVMFKGVYYDPEGTFAGWGTIFGVSVYPKRHQIIAKNKI